MELTDNPLVGISSNKNVSNEQRLFDHDRGLLKQWASLEGIPYYSIFGFKVYNASHPIARLQKKIGGVEKICMMIQNFEMDKDMDGTITAEELETAKERQKELIDQFTSTVGTAGVIGALVFSGLFSTLQIPLNPSNDSTSYFSDDAITGISYLYYGLLYCSFIGSCYVVLMSFIFFHELSTWMPNNELRYWYIREVSILPVIIGAVVTVSLSLITIICGIAVNVGPTQALMCLLAVLLTGITLGLQFMKLLSICVTALHKHCRTIVGGAGKVE
eukprot:gene35289-45695_t